MIVSAAAHGAVLIYAVVGFNSAKEFDPYKEALPVEVLTLSEFDQLTKGSNASKTIADKPKVQAKKVAAATPDPPPPAPEAKENVAAPPPEPEAVETPPPPPEPPKEEPKKAEAAPAIPEPKPADLPKPPEKKVDDNSQAELDKLIKKEVEKKPEKKVEKKPDKPKPKFDPSKIASLVDKRDPGMKPQNAPELSNVTTAGVSAGTAPQLSLSMQSMIGAMIQEQLYACWAWPAGVTPSPDLVATITFEVTQDGVLAGAPRLANNSGNPSFTAFAESAMRAIHSCTASERPLRLPAEHYSFWKNITLDFILPPA
jgi:colicin import membrane protein